MERAIAVAVGLSAAYLFLAIVVAALVESIATVLNLRARNLEASLAGMLTEPLSKRVLADPILRSVAAASGKQWFFFKRKPSYVSRGMYLDALIEQVRELKAATAAGTEAAKETYDQLLADLPAPARAKVQATIASFVAAFDTEAESARARAEEWFDAGMERMSGTYKRHAQLIARLCAVVLVVILNANAVVMTQALWKDPALRASAAKVADAVQAACPPPEPVKPGQIGEQVPDDGRESACKQVLAKVMAADDETLKLPFGWSEARKEEARGNLLLWIVGALLSIAGIGLGAPFWFDLLRRIAPSSVTQTGPRPKG